MTTGKAGGHTHASTAAVTTQPCATGFKPCLAVSILCTLPMPLPTCSCMNLQCPYDVALIPLLTQLTMGRMASGTLHAKLCDLLKRPAEACKGGRYHVRS